MAEIAEASPTAEAPAATPSPAPASTPTATAPATGSDATGAAPSEDTFFSGDPNSLPPEIRKHYDNMLKDYKQKTQAIAERSKKADAYDQLSRDQKFVQYWTSQQNGGQTPQEQKAEIEVALGKSISDEEFAKAFESKESFLNFLEKTAKQVNAKTEKELSTLKQQQSVSQASDIVESFASEVGKDGKAIRPDFYALDEDQLITGYLNINPPANEREYQAKLDEAYQWAKGVSQKYYEKGKSEALAIIQKKATSSTEMPSATAKNAYTGTDPKKLDVSEAIALAKKGVRIPQNY